MKRYGRLALLSGAAFLALGILQVRSADGFGGHGAGARINYVAAGVAERVVDLVRWTSDQFWGTPDGPAVASGAAAQEGEFRWTGRIDSGDAIEIKGVNGDIVAEVADGNTVEVVAEKRSRRSDADEVRIEVVEHGGGVTICAVYPGAGNRCAPGAGGRSEVKDNDVRVTFHVRVPEGVDFVGRTVNGDVGAVDMASNLDVSTVNGRLDVETSGAVQGTTVNGSIHAAMAARDWNGTLELTTVNGSIELDVADDIDADIEASWVNGGLDTDLPLSVRGRMSRRHAEGSLGRGGPEIELTTVNGSIRIR